MKFLIEWFARHGIAANMLAIATIVGGYIAFNNTPKEIIPRIEPNMISIVVSMPGAGPNLTESALCTPIENIVKSIPKIERIRSNSSNNQCMVNIILDSSADIKAVTANIDSLLSVVPLPPLASKPIINNSQQEWMVLRLSVTGLVDYKLLMSTANKVVEDLKALGIGKVSVIDNKSYKILVEVSEAQLQQYQISFAEISNALRQNTLNVPTGHVTSDKGISSVVVAGEYESFTQLSNTIIRSLPDGTQLRLGDIATIKDAYSGVETRINGLPSVAISINQEANTNIFDVSKTVEKYLAIKQNNLPPDVSLLLVFDNAKFFDARMDYLKSNFSEGLLISSLILLLWLRFRLAFWISIDIPIAFCGGMIWLHLMGASINMVSCFGLIIVLGIVCDDAIVIGENIYRHQSTGKPGVEGAVIGVLEVAKPVIFAVCTTALMFMPLLYLPGSEGKLMRPLPLTVIAILFASLVEALLALPSHLAHQTKKTNVSNMGYAIAEKMDAWVLQFYRPLLKLALHWRYSVLVMCLSMFILSISLVASGRVKVHFFTSIETEVATGSVSFSDINDTDKTLAAVKKMEQAALELKEDLFQEFGVDQITLVRSLVGDKSIHGDVYLVLAASGDRKIDNPEMMARWKEKVGPIPESAKLTYSSVVDVNSTSFSILLHSSNSAELIKASEALKQHLQEYEGVFKIHDSSSEAHEEVRLRLKPEAFDLGLNLQTISTQIRMALVDTSLQSLNGESVVLKLPDEERNSLWRLENLPIQIDPLTTVPLSSIMNITYEKSPNNIMHVDGQRISYISAELDESTITYPVLLQKVQQDFLNNLDENFPAVKWSKTGSIEAESKIKNYLGTSFIVSLIGMFILLSVFLNSYYQPFMIFSAIPYGIVGALLGHLICGEQLTLWSLAGMIAVSGIVVNNNMVIIFFINNKIEEGADLTETILLAGADRFRPIMLTTITTFVGVLPTIVSNSWEAQFLIPLAISIGFGVLFAAILTLFLVPTLYLISDDLKQWVAKNASWIPLNK